MGVSTGFQIATFGSLIAILTLILSSGDRLRNFLMSVQNLWLAKVTLDDHLATATYSYCFKNMKLFGLRSQVCSGCHLPIAGKRVDQLIGFEIYKQSSLWFRKGLKTLIICPGDWRYDDTTMMFCRTMTLLLPRFFWRPQEFMRMILEDFNVQGINTNRFSIVRFCGKNKSAPIINLDSTTRTDISISGTRTLLEEVRLSRAQIINNINLKDIKSYQLDKPFDWYAYPSDVMDVVENIRHWQRNRSWYTEKRIPWRRGLLLHGPTGTGKTLLAKCIAQDLNMPVFLFEIASMDNAEFEQFWRDAQFHAPCMILVEDFDTVFHGRENITKMEGLKLTFDCLLNCVSGIESSEGILLVITTNNEEHIDPALGISKGDISTRPGRIDDVILLDLMTEECRRIMASRILEISGDSLERVVNQTEGMTSAQFIEYCNKVALQFVTSHISITEILKSVS